MSRAVVGVSDHAGWAVLVTVRRGKLVDRRRIDLIDPDLPSLPHHHEAQALSREEGVALVERVADSAKKHARAALDALAAEVQSIAGITLRRSPALPPTIVERIESYHAQTRADSVMYRDVLVVAAKAKGWKVWWYEPKTVFAEAARALDVRSVNALLRDTGLALGPPWRLDHRQAMAAAIAAGK